MLRYHHCLSVISQPLQDCHPGCAFTPHALGALRLSWPVHNQLQHQVTSKTIVCVFHCSFTLAGICTVCPEKKRPKCFFCNIFYKTFASPMKFDTQFFKINLLQKHINVSHLTSIMSLHYLVKLEAHMLPFSCQIEKLQNLSHLNCGLQMHQI